jgi:hypothetical protein
MRYGGDDRRRTIWIRALTRIFALPKVFALHKIFAMLRITCLSNGAKLSGAGVERRFAPPLAAKT